MSKRTIFQSGRIDWHEGTITLMLSGPGGMVAADIQRRARAVQKRAQRKAPVDTGELRSSISVDSRYRAEGVVATVTAEAPHAVFVEFGRRAISGKRMAWQEFGRVVFANSVAATKPVHFMRDALDAAKD